MSEVYSMLTVSPMTAMSLFYAEIAFLDIASEAVFYRVNLKYISSINLIFVYFHTVFCSIYCAEIH